jgi:hypothetical protein
MEIATGAGSNFIAGLAVPVTYASISTYPYNTVVLIETKNPADPGHFTIGSGVIIGPHTVSDGLASALEHRELDGSESSMGLSRL